MTTGHSHDRPRAVFAVLATAGGSFALLQSLVTPVLSTIQHSMHTSQNTVTWALTAYLLSASVFTPIIGRLGDVWGKQRMLVISLLALAAGALLAALADTIGVLIAARALQGVGGGVLPLSFGIIRDEYPADEVSGKVAVIASLLAGGAGFGLVLAGPIVSALGYHWLFWIPFIVLVCAALAAHFVVPSSPVRPGQRINWSPAVLLSAWLVALLVAISQAPTAGWGSPTVLGLGAASAVLAATWVRVETRVANPLIDMRMMRIPAIWTTNLVALLLGVSMYSAFAFLPEFVQTPRSAGYGFGATIIESGLIVLPSSLAMFAVGFVTGRLTYRFGGRLVLIAGLTITIGTYALLTLAHDRVWEIVAAMLIQGLGTGLSFAALASLVVASVPDHQTGVASGMNANIRTIGGALGAAVTSSVIAAGARTGSLPHASGYTNGFAVLTLASVGAAAAGLLVPRPTAGATSRPALSAGPAPARR